MIKLSLLLHYSGKGGAVPGKGQSSGHGGGGTALLFT